MYLPKPDYQRNFKYGIFCRFGSSFSLFRSSLPLLKSRNSGVVLAVCTTHYYCGSQTSSTMNQIAKAMVRILRNRREIQFVVLDAIRSVVAVLLFFFNHGY